MGSIRQTRLHRKDIQYSIRTKSGNTRCLEFVCGSGTSMRSCCGENLAEIPRHLQSSLWGVAKPNCRDQLEGTQPRDSTHQSNTDSIPAQPYHISTDRWSRSFIFQPSSLNAVKWWTLSPCEPLFWEFETEALTTSLQPHDVAVRNEEIWDIVAMIKVYRAWTCGVVWSSRGGRTMPEISHCGGTPYYSR